MEVLRVARVDIRLYDGDGHFCLVVFVTRSHRKPISEVMNETADGMWALNRHGCLQKCESDSLPEETRWQRYGQPLALEVNKHFDTTKLKQRKRSHRPSSLLVKYLPLHLKPAHR